MTFLKNMKIEFVSLLKYDFRELTWGHEYTCLYDLQDK